ncbi:hypothetical protein CPC08DRAFT_792891 [Agrocybe pediades]|nr:hypothetical protein CPC08DRAFT_792891 [Agrocybe pediades]
MDEPITKRLIISGLTPAITAEDISRRLTTFGTVKAADGFGLPDGLGQPRKFGYVTLETTVGKLSKCMNLLSGSTWKGAKLRFGEAKPDFREKQKRHAAVLAEDMSLVTPENAAQRPGWKVSALGRITRPVKMRPAHPLIAPLEEKKVKKVPGRDKKAGEEKKKKKRVKDPDTRARRQVIDMPKYGSTHLKGMFLDLEVTGTSRKSPPPPVEDIDEDSSSSESESEEEEVVLPPPTVKSPVRKSQDAVEAVAGPSKVKLPESPVKAKSTVPEPSSALPDNNVDVQKEKVQTLSLLNTLFGDDDDDWVGRESVGSDIDVDELVKGDVMLVDEEQEAGFEVVPKSTPGKPLYIPSQDAEEDEEEDEEPSDQIAVDPPSAPAIEEKSSKKSTLKDLFAPREEEAGFSLLGHLDLDVELDEELPFVAEQPIQQQAHEPQPISVPTPVVLQTQNSQAPLVLNPKQALFFPLATSHEQSGAGVNRARQRDVFDLVKDNGWNWRDPSVGFYRTGTDEDIKKRWEESKGDLTRDWKRRCREAAKVNRRKRGGVEENES